MRVSVDIRRVDQSSTQFWHSGQMYRLPICRLSCGRHSHAHADGAMPPAFEDVWGRKPVTPAKGGLELALGSYDCALLRF